MLTQIFLSQHFLSLFRNEFCISSVSKNGEDRADRSHKAPGKGCKSPPPCLGNRANAIHGDCRADIGASIAEAAGSCRFSIGCKAAGKTGYVKKIDAVHHAANQSGKKQADHAEYGLFKRNQNGKKNANYGGK